MATPIVVSFLLAIPVLVTWVGKIVSKKADPAEHQGNQDEENAGPSAKAETTWSMRYEKTVDTYWNNIMFWCVCSMFSEYTFYFGCL
jgi:hypothetical protein